MNIKQCWIILTVFLCTLWSIAPLSCIGSSATEIDFDTFPDGSEVPHNTALTDQYLAYGVVFEAGWIVTSGDISAPSYWQNLPDGAYSPPNVTNVSTTGLSGRFVVPNKIDMPAVTDELTIRFYDTEVGSTLGTITVFDPEGQQIASKTVETPAATYADITISAPNIASFEVVTDGDGAGMDNMRWAPLTKAP